MLFFDAEIINFFPHWWTWDKNPQTENGGVILCIFDRSTLQLPEMHSRIIFLSFHCSGWVLIAHFSLGPRCWYGWAFPVVFCFGQYCGEPTGTRVRKSPGLCADSRLRKQDSPLFWSPVHTRCKSWFAQKFACKTFVNTAISKNMFHFCMQ